jgi:hypothetical protein
VIGAAVQARSETLIHQLPEALDSYVLNVQQNHFNKVYRAKLVLSKDEGTPRTGEIQKSPFHPPLAKGRCEKIENG